jgi:hypothetical protein
MSTMFPTSDGMAPVMALLDRDLPNIHPRQHHVWWELGGGCVSGQCTYSIVSATSCPTSDGMAPVMVLPFSILPKHPPTSAPRLVGAGWKVRVWSHVQFRQCHQLPDGRWNRAGYLG